MTDPHDTRTMALPLTSQVRRIPQISNREKCLAIADSMRPVRRLTPVKLPVPAAKPAPTQDSDGLAALKQDDFELQEHRIQIGPLDI